MTISVVCARCRRIVQQPGVPYTSASIYDAARALGWVVRAPLVYCPACGPSEAPKDSAP